MPDREDVVTSSLDTATRRRLLTIAAGGFVALGSGLLLPGAIDEVAARKPAKRRRRRRQRDRRSMPPPPQSSLNNISFHVQNLTQRPIKIVYWDQKDEVSDHSWYQRTDKQLPPNPTRSNADMFVSHYAADWPGSLLWIADPGILVRAVNAFLLAPAVTIGKGGAVSAPDGWTNGTTLFDERMAEGAGATRTIDDRSSIFSYTVKVHRNDDLNARKIYAITVDDPT